MNAGSILRSIGRQIPLPNNLRRQLRRWIREKPQRLHERIYNKYRAFTMVPKSTFLHNLELVAHHSSVEGCIVECGVWRGGSIAAIADLLGPKREYYLFDSFDGLPPAQEIDGAAATEWQLNTESPSYFDNCKASRDYAEQAMRLSGAIETHIVPGWFETTLPGFLMPNPIAILRLDGDWYDSTMTCLRSLFPQMAPGGIIIVDDYHAWDGCRRAVHDYLSESKSTAKIMQWMNDVTYIKVFAA